MQRRHGDAARGAGGGAVAAAAVADDAVRPDFVKRVSHVLPGGVWVALFVWRVASAVLLATSFNPDEYWQALEPAHRAVFGYGYLTWEWREGLRSYAHPAVYMPIYWLLKVINLDESALLILAPKALSGVIVAVGDACTYQLALRLFSSPNVARWTLLLSATSWFHLFCSARSLANSLEAVLVVASLSTWPWTPDRSTIAQSRRALLLAALAVVVRPTAAIFFLPILLAEPFMQLRGRAFAPWILGAVVPAGACAIGLMLAVDRIFYGEWTFSWLTFLRFNVLQNLAGFYGTHRWHWYLVQGLPMVFLTSLPLVALGAANAAAQHKRLVLAAVIAVAVFSLLPHKEPRFLLPLLPMMLPFGGQQLATWIGDPQRGGRRAAGVLIALMVTNAIPAIYFGAVHQRGVLDVMWWLRGQGSALSSVLLLMPCHSLPHQAYLHRPDVALRFLTCEPPLAGQSLAAYEDEADLFYKAPSTFLDKHIDLADYSHIVLFESLLPNVADQLAERHVQCARFFNSHFIDDDRKAGDVVVFCARATKPSMQS